VVSQCIVPPDRDARQKQVDTFLASRTLRFAIVGESNFGYLRYMDAGGKISIRPNPPSEVPEAARLFSTRHEAEAHADLHPGTQVVAVYIDPSDRRTR
jgi:hypothetical protein